MLPTFPTQSYILLVFSQFAACPVTTLDVIHVIASQDLLVKIIKTLVTVNIILMSLYKVVVPTRYHVKVFIRLMMIELSPSAYCLIDIASSASCPSLTTAPQAETR